MMRRPAGMGGGSLLRAVGRAVGTGGLSAAAGGPCRPARVVSVASPSHSSSSSSSSFYTTSPRGESQRVYPCVVCDDWVAVDEWAMEDDGELSERYVFRAAPTVEEAEEAVATLRQIFIPTSYYQVSEDEASSDDGMMVNMKTSTDMMQRSPLAAPELDWIEPSAHLLHSRECYSQEHEKVLDAFRLLQINPSIQRMVISLSSDKSVWDAVMNNEVVREIRNSFNEAESSPSENSNGEKDGATGAGVLTWVMENVTAKIVEFMEKINKIVNELFHSQKKDNESDMFDTAVRSSIMLSVMVFLVVVVTRIRKP